MKKKTIIYWTRAKAKKFQEFARLEAEGKLEDKDLVEYQLLTIAHLLYIKTGNKYCQA